MKQHVYGIILTLFAVAQIACISEGIGSVTAPSGVTPSCPTGFIEVPGDATFGTSDFCMAKYEMKDAGSSVPVSQASGVPWNLLDQTAAASACSAKSWKLISNAQWQTVARNIEAQAANWSGAAVGSGMLRRGHTDNVVDGTNCVSAPCAASTDDADGFYGTANSASDAWGSGAEQNRTHVLSNGEVVWDFSGNVAEWVSGTVGTDVIPSPSLSAAGTVQFSTLSAANRLLFGPSGSYTSTESAGQLIAGSGSYGGAMVRGGHRNSGLTGGIFAVDLTVAPTLTNQKIGFRCVVAK